MKQQFLILCFACFLMSGKCSWEEDFARLKKSIETLGQQVMMQQMYIEERIRSAGDSGIKNIRLNAKATNPYLTATYSKKSNSAIHDHSNNIRTVGMGEVVAVLNGVEFRTRHNDYRLYMKGKKSTEPQEYREIPFPKVPGKVTNKATVEEQIEEMKLWFKAFKDQDYSVRDYRKFFKPVLCYMEGAWTLPQSGEIAEPFPSDRHQIDAKSWADLRDKIRFTSNTGTKSNLENFAYMPTTISKLLGSYIPEVAQWNYKIFCHPLSRDVPLNRLKMIDDFASRMIREYTMNQQELSRAARYRVNPYDSGIWLKKEESFYSGLLDDLMYEIPGADNYNADITDDAFGMAATKSDDSTLNAGYYHRIFKTNKKGAMGLQLISRGFNDQNLYVALTTRPDIMPLSYEHCTGGWKKRVCQEFQQKATYAIPLEIIYLTPLYTWNPYGIVYRGDKKTPEAKEVTNGGRNGQPTKELAYNGIHSKLFYQTPVEFFGGGDINRDAADTSSASIAVLGSDGEPKNVSASGTRIFLPAIGDIGNIRLRYPINPVHDEGSVVRKELEAVKKAFLELGRYMHMLREPINAGLAEDVEAPFLSINTVIKTGDSTRPDITPHHHTIELNDYDLTRLSNGNEISKYTSVAAGHSHVIEFTYNNDQNLYKISECDNEPLICWDGHPTDMERLATP